MKWFSMYGEICEVWHTYIHTASSTRSPKAFIKCKCCTDEGTSSSQNISLLDLRHNLFSSYQTHFFRSLPTPMRPFVFFLVSFTCHDLEYWYIVNSLWRIANGLMATSCLSFFLCLLHEVSHSLKMYSICWMTSKMLLIICILTAILIKLKKMTNVLLVWYYILSIFETIGSIGSWMALLWERGSGFVVWKDSEIMAEGHTHNWLGKTQRKE